MDTRKAIQDQLARKTWPRMMRADARPQPNPDPTAKTWCWSLPSHEALSSLVPVCYDTHVDGNCPNSDCAQIFAALQHFQLLRPEKIALAVNQLRLPRPITLKNPTKQLDGVNNAVLPSGGDAEPRWSKVSVPPSTSTRVPVADEQRRLPTPALAPTIASTSTPNPLLARASAPADAEGRWSNSKRTHLISRSFDEGLAEKHGVAKHVKRFHGHHWGGRGRNLVVPTQCGNAQWVRRYS